MEEQTTQVAEQPVVKAKNGLGLAGFIIALVGLVFCWVPILGHLLWPIALTLSIIGLILGIVKKRKLGLAIAGIIISGASVIVAVLISMSIAASLNGMTF